MNQWSERIQNAFPARITGRVHRYLGAIAESRGLFAPVGARCDIVCRGGDRIPAEVVGFRDDLALVAPCSEAWGIAAGDPIEYCGRVASIRVGHGILGRVVNADGTPIDSHGPVDPPGVEMPLHNRPENPLERQPVDRVLATGIRAVDGLLTAGRGQRLGILAGSGVGKSMLLGMLARGAEAPVVVLGLIGERSREVREFVEREIGPAGLRRAVVVAATAEQPALERLQAALAATAVAEFFRDRGEHVLLLVDSLTRVAMAQREIGLAMGEPPATRGYPPSVFSLLPRLLERAGPGSRGSITGFYTALLEADEKHDPVADCVRAALDGHIWLSRELAERGQFPAIDPLASMSRVQPRLVRPRHARAVRAVRRDLTRFQEVEELIRLGAYAPGSDPETDAAIRRMPSIRRFLAQDRDEVSRYDETVADLERLVSGADPSGEEPFPSEELDG